MFMFSNDKENISKLYCLVGKHDHFSVSINVHSVFHLNQIQDVLQIYRPIFSFAVAGTMQVSHIRAQQVNSLIPLPDRHNLSHYLNNSIAIDGEKIFNKMDA